MTQGEISVSLAGIATPLVVGACAATVVTWRFSFVIAFVLVMTAAIAVYATKLPDLARPPAAGTHDTGRRTPRRTLVTIFAVVGMEFTLSFWAATYLHDEVGIDQDVAVALVSVLDAANLVGRVVASRLARRLPTGGAQLSLATALAGTPILLAADNPVLAGAGLVVTGIGIGGAFPLASALHVAAQRSNGRSGIGPDPHRRRRRPDRRTARGRCPRPGDRIAARSARPSRAHPSRHRHDPGCPRPARGSRRDRRLRHRFER